MNKNIKTKAKYTNGVFKPKDPIDLSDGAEVEIIIIEEDLIKKFDEIETQGLMKLVEEDPAFEFLKDPREDIYTVDDLKERYK